MNGATPAGCWIRRAPGLRRSKTALALPEAGNRTITSIGYSGIAMTGTGRADRDGAAAPQRGAARQKRAQRSHPDGLSGGFDVPENEPHPDRRPATRRRMMRCGAGFLSLGSCLWQFSETDGTLAHEMTIEGRYAFLAFHPWSHVGDGIAVERPYCRRLHPPCI